MSFLGTGWFTVSLALARVTAVKLEKHYLTSCHTELQSKFTGRPIRHIFTSPPALPRASLQMSLSLCKLTASSLSTHSKNSSFLVPSKTGMLTRMWLKFLCWVDVIKVLRTSVCTTCAAWLCCSCILSCAVAVFCAIYSCNRDRFIMAILQSSTDPPGGMNENPGGPWSHGGPGELGGPEPPGLNTTSHGSPGGPRFPGGPHPGKPGRPPSRKTSGHLLGQPRSPFPDTYERPQGCPYGSFLCGIHPECPLSHDSHKSAHWYVKGSSIEAHMGDILWYAQWGGLTGTVVCCKCSNSDWIPILESSISWGWGDWI